MRIFKKSKWLSAFMASVIAVSSVIGAGSAPVPAAAAAAGASYLTDRDNVGTNGTGSADGDMDIAVGNPLGGAQNNAKWPIEFNINVPDDSPPLDSVALLIRANDVDEEQGEWDRVFFGQKLPGSTLPTIREIGNLSGNNDTWNTTILYLDPDMVKHGDNYVEIRVDDKQNPKKYNWVVTVDWGQFVLNNGPRDMATIKPATVLNGNGGGTTTRTVNTGVIATPGGAGKSYLVEVNLLDSTGNNVGTITQVVSTPTAGIEVPVTATFNTGNTEPDIKAAENYTANVILYEYVVESGKNSPKKAQDIWASNKPAIVKDIEISTNRTDTVALNQSMFAGKFFDLDTTPDPLAKVKLTSLPTGGTLKLNGTPVTLSNGERELTLAQLDQLTFTPAPGWNGDEISFDWNGFDGTIYALASAKVKFTAKSPVIKSAKVESDPVEDPFKLRVAYDKPITLTDSLTPQGYSVTFSTYGPVTVTGVTYDKGEAVLTIDRPVAGEDVYISYTPAGGTTTDLLGNPAAPFSNYLIDRVKPEIVSGVVKDGAPKTVELTYNEPVELLNISGLTVNVQGVPATVTGITYNGPVVVLTLADPVSIGDVVTVSYDPGTGNLHDIAGNSGKSQVNVPVDNQLRAPLDGWVGSRNYTDTDPVIVAPGDPLKLSALSTPDADKVIAILFYGQEGMEKQVELTLKETNAGYKRWEYVTYRLPDQVTTGQYTPEFKAFKGATELLAEADSRLANNVFNVVSSVNLKGTVTDQAGSNPPIEGATVTLYDPTGTKVITIKDGGGIEQPVKAVTGADGAYLFPNVPAKNYLMVVEKSGYGTQKKIIRALPAAVGQTDIVENFVLAPFSIKLTANPTSIVGDGTSQSELTAVVLDQQGNPVADTEVVFSAAVGTFANGYTEGGLNKGKARTDAQGKATILYKSEAIEGIISREIPVKATVNDPTKGLQGEEQIMISFQPAKIYGVITNTVNGQTIPAPGSVVKVTNDFDGDGVIDFAGEAITDANGNYSIAVPRGGAGVVYNLEITKPVQTKDGETLVTYTQKAPVTQEVTGGGQSFDSSKTITGIVGLQTPDQKIELLGADLLGKMKVYLKAKGGGYIEDGAGHPKAFTLGANGVFSADIADNIAANTEYEIEIKYVMSEAGKQDKEVVMNRKADGSLPVVKVSSNGEMNITEALIDPYGTITNAYTGAVIEGANVELRYANTQRNIDNGRTPGTLVNLTVLPEFEPNKNANPQTSSALGKYAYMVYPEADYTVVVTKPGYYPYTSPTIPVEWDIVKHDVKMNPILSSSSSGGGGGGYIAPTESTPVDNGNTAPKLALNLSVKNNMYEEGTEALVTATFANNGNAVLKSGEVSIAIPDNAIVVDADGGVVTGNAITWTVADLAPGQTGSHTVKLRFPQINAAESVVELKGQFAGSDAAAVESDSSKSSLKVLLFSKRFENIQHQRYILGYPDGEFKPQRTLTRAELSAIIARLLNGGAATEGASVYTDVPTTHWAAGYIGTVTDSGIFNGFEDGSFQPDKPISREELAVVLARFLKLDMSAAITPHFADAQGRWSSDAIEALYRNSLAGGYPDGTFKPADNIIRVEAVTLINNILFRGPLTDAEVTFPDVTKAHWGFGAVEEASVTHEASRSSDGSEVLAKKLQDQVK
ncbi:S-layer homology domain-containing protein [Paenibacillus thalictri]|uniref:S-layer homology domain-containing protein n=1 Tax=Paenibacillus thalictri TaxID=2527873 RepID=A0A4Q9DYN3_9BACL|nr:S-layer homology domain-containing protein [Paenibacillus thalictri]TBL81545.1 hypothetical protein EYB31_00590 [Paenibacillus thalictri]